MGLETGVRRLHSSEDVGGMDAGKDKLALELRDAQLGHWIGVLLPPLRVNGNDGSIIETAGRVIDHRRPEEVAQDLVGRLVLKKLLQDVVASGLVGADSIHL
ncbi:hypothetical protein PtrARCrB10_09639 [Pyrenophora tritici-repentis]|nr:hypothetical protein PtrARCrB10_09639 [Pyrenophora tritici-repentis]